MILCGYFLDGTDLCYDHFLKGELELELMLKAHGLIRAEEVRREKSSFLGLYTARASPLPASGKRTKIVIPAGGK